MSVEKVRGFDDLKKRISNFPIVQFDYKQINSVVQSCDLKDPSNRILLMNEWLNEPMIFPDANTETLMKLPWLNLGSFNISLIPITPKQTNVGTLFRLVTMGSSSLEETVEYDIYSLYSGYVFGPQKSCLDGFMRAYPGKISAIDMRIRGIPNEDGKFLMMIFHKKGEYRQFQMLKIRMQILLERAHFSVFNYQDLKDSKFLGLTQQKNIHPNLVKLMIYFLIALDRRKVKKREIQQAKDLGFLHPEANTLSEVNFNDPKWIKDYIDSCEYWVLDEGAPNLFEAAKMI